jgi:hypothetical protein
VRELGRARVEAELRVKARSDPTFPSHTVFAQFGGKARLVEAARKHCADSGASDAVDMLPAIAHGSPGNAPSILKAVTTGFVYLMKSGKLAA